ncbi:putative tryptophan hydroxylase VioD [Streptomyces sp. ADI91-18]|uniref:FAD-dependent monooxygenase n=1 Tax=Streptomyces sp. ADI91-18 TaxID=1522755 RepID=UPI000FB7DB74|nr:FAD-dependent monooxygenase [Streptomyces sp. ADI91-18]RPK24627.1 putative tryptophan hydroxylase VioD [Streptomyces sp. ADI91-18]
MRVDIIGGGPGGLLTAVLLRRLGVADDVRVFERHEADTTYGWGVVFPEGALDQLAKAAPDIHAAVVAAGTTWTHVDVRHQGFRRRVNGNRFHGIARATLLGILQRAAAEAGARLTFGHAVESLDAHEGADLIVGADGVRSVVREAHRDRFLPEVKESEFVYAWFGTERVFDDFTYVFRDTPWGIFRAYVYPSGQPWSSLIVHASPEAWEKSGLSGMDEAASARLCEQIFAQDLEGAPILSKGSPWMRFPHLSCATWHHDNIVLIGDAAHTAHWSIGSGTRLAVEDAIVLAGELATRQDTLTGALARFEEVRRPQVRKFQTAARRSERYFEKMPRYLDFEPDQFAYQLTARSWKITHSDIARRDPEFIARYDGWFHSRAAGTPVEVAPSPAFAPLRVGPLVLPNRIVSLTGARGAGLSLVTASDLHNLPAAPDGGNPAGLRVPVLDGPEEYSGLAERALAAGYAMVVMDLGHDTEAGLTALKGLRGHWPADRPVAVALPAPRATDDAGEALDAAELVELAGRLATAGSDALLVDGVPLADALRNEARITVLVDAASRSRDDVDTVVAAGWADACVLHPMAPKLVERESGVLEQED